MYGNGQVIPRATEAAGDFMQIGIDSGNIFSTYIDYPDSLNKERIYAKITTEQESYEAKTINYNYQLSARIYHRCGDPTGRWLCDGSAN